MRVLLVDDDLLAGEIVAAILEEAGHEVVLAEGPRQALDILAAEEVFAGVISDMNMPELSGLDLLREMRGRGCRLPFLLLSGENPERLKERGGDQVDACLAKDMAMMETLPAVVEKLFAVDRDSGHG
jgi:CheY-like chemotaxis protein